MTSGEDGSGRDALMRLMALIDRFCERIEDITAQVRGRAELLPASARRRKGRLRLFEGEGGGDARLEAYVDQVTIEELPDGALVHFGAYPPVRLPFLLAHLVEVLCCGEPNSNDGLVNWKSLTVVQQLLQKKTGGAYSPGAVRNLLYRLRKALHRASINPNLVLESRRRGYRLAVKWHPPANETAASMSGT